MIPEDPPSSATVTTAVISASLLRKPFKITGRPVPPPMTTILGVFLVCCFMSDSPSPFVYSYHDVTYEPDTL